MIKQVALECEQQKSKLRAVRKRYMDKVRVIEKNVSISKDDISSMKKKIDEITDKVSKEMAEMMKRKEKELDIWLDPFPSTFYTVIFLVCFINYGRKRFIRYSNLFLYSKFVASYE